MDFLNNLEVAADFTESGTGLFINKSTVLTATHVYESAKNHIKEVQIHCGNTTWYGSLDKSYKDSCTLKIRDNYKKGVTKFKTANFRMPIGTTLRVIGYPYSCLNLRYAEGKVLDNDESLTTIESNVPAVVGLSGSPVFVDDNGNGNCGPLLIGVVSYGDKQEIRYFNEDDRVVTQISKLKNLGIF